MRLTTIGTGTVPSPARVNAGHLVEAGDVRLLLDCGSGVAHRMSTLALDWLTVTHVALTHFHADHVLDIPTLLVAWRYGVLPPRSEPVEIIGPVGAIALLERFAAIFGDTIRASTFPITIREIHPGETLALGSGVSIEARKVPHTGESIAYCVRRGRARLVYTGDTGVDDELGRWARDCDVLLAECSLPDPLAIPTHLSPERCAALAAAALPGCLALTHFYPLVEQVDVRAIVASRFGGTVVLTTDGWTTEIEDF
jgi:ribonuclease BN (tRNA processing enzyme)